MVTSKFILGSLATASLAALLGVQANVAHAAEACVFDKYTPTSAAPYRSVESSSPVEPYGYTPPSFLSGAQLFVPAQEGLTKEWLALSVERALNEGKACNPDVRPAKVIVTSAGDGFWVQLTAHDEQQAKALLQWANQIVKHEAARTNAHASVSH